MKNKSNLEDQGTCYSKEEFTNTRTYLYKYRYKTVRKMMVGPKVLEVGVGNADLTNWMSGDGSFDIVSIDGSKTVLDSAARKISHPERVKFIHTLFEEFDSDIMFDDILVTNSLEHVDYPVGLLQHMVQFLKTSGRLHITVPNAMSIHRMLGKEMGMLERETSLNSYDIEVGHQRVYTIGRLKFDVYLADLIITSQDGIMLKPLSDSYMSSYNKELMEGLASVGHRLPGLAAEIYFCCRRKIGD